MAGSHHGSQRVRITGIAAAWVVLGLLATAQQLETLDKNEDGEPDRWMTMRNGAVFEYRTDIDFDGRVDSLIRYGSGQKIAYEEYDYNLDGHMDDFYFYDDGKLKRREVDSNYDLAVDIWVHLFGGTYIERMERDTDFDGAVDVVKDYRRQ